MKKLFLCLFVLFLCLFLAGTACGENAPVLKTQPQDRTVRCNTIFALNVRAEGENLSFLWQYRAGDSGEWTDWRTTSVGYMYAFALPEMDQRQVRCVVSNAGGSVASRTFSLEVLPNISEVWYTLPLVKGTVSSSRSIRMDPGTELTLTVHAYGAGLTYQWYYLGNSSIHRDVLEGKTTPELTLTVKEEDNCSLLDCVVTDNRGRTVSMTDTAMLASLAVSQPAPADSEITLWFLNSWAVDYLSIPAGLLQQYDLNGKTAKLLSGDSAEASDGVVRPAGGQTIGAVSGTVSYSCSEGDNTFRLSDGSVLSVHVRDYAKAYADQVMEDYLAAHVTPGMTEYEKAVQCCRFSASYDYDAAYSGVSSLVATGGGDCWAHSDAVLTLLKKLGISAAYHDEREGSFAGHINVMAKLDGAYYILETSYYGTDPDNYSVTYSATPFLLRKLSDGTAAIQTYLDPEGPADLVIPQTIEGLTVTAIDRGAFQARQELRSVTVPETVTSIGEKAFVNCQHLVSAKLPASLRELGAVVFGLCYDLERIDVTPGNPVFSSANGILLGKGGAELLAVPYHYQGTCEVPDGVTSIANSACQNMEFDTFILPGTIREIGEVVFYGTRINRLVLGEGITEIPYGAFANLTVKEVVLPRSLKTIGAHAFAQSYITNIEFSEGLETIGESAFEACSFQSSRLVLPSTLKSIGSRAFLYSNIGGVTVTIGDAESKPDPVNGMVIFNKYSSPTFGENVFSRLTLGVWSGSTALEYALQTGTPYYLLDAEGRTTLQPEWFKLAVDSAVYKDEPWLEPPVYLTGSEPHTLQENVDYLVTYENNDLPGTATAVITGIGAWEGTVRLQFRTTAADRFVTDRNGNTYYYDYKGEKITGTHVFDGVTLFFDENGVLSDRILGDINGDKTVDGRDAIRLMKYLAGEIDEETGEVFAISEKNADLNQDGVTDELDLLRLMKFLGGEIDELN